uniref:Hepatic lectin-like n=1 Tax=Oreochromis niloticus TaxID=8128 RepID=I3JBT7_ORENI
GRWRIIIIIIIIRIINPTNSNMCASWHSLCFNIFKGDPCSKCEEGWEQHGGKCYYFSTNKSSWNESRDECRAKGGDLEFLGKKVRGMMTDHEDKFWIGLTDSAEQGRWLWVDGSPLNKSWSDTSCKVSHRSICEKPAAKGQNKTVCEIQL